MTIQRVLNDSRKVVIKIGSNVLSNAEGTVDFQRFANITEQVQGLIRQGRQVIVVSSGAGICGVGAINKWSRRGDVNYKQALCAIGQVELMAAYKKYFAEYGIHVGQILLTRDDFTDEERQLHVRNTLFTLIDEGVLPVINENDSVAIEEFSLGDNDTLSALTAILWNADALVVLSDIDGVFEKDPKQNPDAALIETVEDISALLASIDITGKSSFGTGGIKTKIEAAQRAWAYQIPTILLNGKKKNISTDALEGRAAGTCFHGAW